MPREDSEAFSPYARMQIPRGRYGPKAAYRRLINGVSMWDAADKRQVQFDGPNATRNTQNSAPVPGEHVLRTPAYGEVGANSA